MYYFIYCKGPNEKRFTLCNPWKGTRGAKHLRELMAMKAAGHRAVLLFMVLHSGIARMRPAAHIDPHYSQLVEQAMAAGVEILCYRPHVGVQGMVAQDFIPFESGHLLPEG